MKAAVGTSNIEEKTLPFDLSIFKSLLQIEVKRLTVWVLWGSVEGKVSNASCSFSDQWLWCRTDQKFAFPQAHTGHTQRPSLRQQHEGTLGALLENNSFLNLKKLKL